MWTLDVHQRFLDMDCRDAKDIMQRIFKVRHLLVTNCTFCITNRGLHIIWGCCMFRISMSISCETSLVSKWVNIWKLEAAIATSITLMVLQAGWLALIQIFFLKPHLGFGLSDLMCWLLAMIQRNHVISLALCHVHWYVKKLGNFSLMDIEIEIGFVCMYIWLHYSWWLGLCGGGRTSSCPSL